MAPLVSPQDMPFMEVPPESVCEMEAHGLRMPSKWRNRQVIPRLDNSSTSEVVMTLLLDWELYQITKNLTYSDHAEILAQRFLNIYQTNRSLNHLGDPDRELGCFCNGSKIQTIHNISNAIMSLYQTRFLQCWQPQSQLRRVMMIPYSGFVLYVRVISYHRSMDPERRIGRV